MNSESPNMMVVHGLILMVILYLIMTMVLKQTPKLAESRAVTIGAFAIVYMVHYGHKIPSLA